MTRFLTGSVAVTALLSAGGAWALTAEEAWEAITAGSSASGTPLAVESQTYTGGVLTVTGLTYAAEGEGFSLTGDVSEAVLTEEGDGSVSIVFGDYLFSVSAAPEDGETFDAAVAVTMPDMQMTATGAPGAVTMTYTAPQILMDVVDLAVDGEPQEIEAEIAINTVTGSYAAGGTAAQPTLSSTFNASQIVGDVLVNEPEGEGVFELDLTMSSVSQSSQGSGSPFFQMDQLPELLAAGFQNTGSFVYGPTALAMSLTGTPDDFALDMNLDGGTTNVQVNQDQVVYNTSSRGLDLALSSSEIPFPQVTAGLGSTTTNLLMPLQMTEADRPFVLKVALEGLSIGNEIWNLFDPAGQLPRDPASLIVNIAGQGRWLVDIFDPEALEAAVMPAQINTLSIPEILLSVAGAELTGNGGFNIDFGRMLPNGMPSAVGSMDLQLVGGNRLLDTLVNMGLLPQEQAMMARMMTGMIAVPGDGPDTLVSEIQITPDGQILANGAPLPFQ